MQCMFWNTCICISHGHGWDERWSDSDGEAAVAPCCRCCWAAGGGGDLLPLQLDVAAVAPLGPPRVLDDPVLLPGGRVLPVPNHGDGVVEPAAAPPSVHALPPEVVEVRVAGPDRDDGHHRLLLLLPAGHHRVHQRRLVVHKHTAAMNCRLSRPSGDRLLDDGVATAAATADATLAVAKANYSSFASDDATADTTADATAAVAAMATAHGVKVTAIIAITVVVSVAAVVAVAVVVEAVVQR